MHLLAAIPLLLAGVSASPMFGFRNHGNFLPSNMNNGRIIQADSPRFGNQRSSPNSNNGVQSSSGVSNSDQKAILAAHNEERAKINAPPLKWDAKLASMAQSHSDKCVMQHGGYPQGVGQNLAMQGGYRDIVGMVGDWIAEKSTYNPDSPRGSGHYTQVVWKETTTIGCGITSCGNQRTIMTCNYYPNGNTNMLNGRIVTSKESYMANVGPGTGGGSSGRVVGQDRPRNQGARIVSGGRIPANFDFGNFGSNQQVDGNKRFTSGNIRDHFGGGGFDDRRDFGGVRVRHRVINSDGSTSPWSFGGIRDRFNNFFRR